MWEKSTGTRRGGGDSGRGAGVAERLGTLRRDSGGRGRRRVELIGLSRASRAADGQSGRLGRRRAVDAASNPNRRRRGRRVQIVVDRVSVRDGVVRAARSDQRTRVRAGRRRRRLHAATTRTKKRRRRRCRCRRLQVSAAAVCRYCVSARRRRYSMRARRVIEVHTRRCYVSQNHRQRLVRLQNIWVWVFCQLRNSYYMLLLTQYCSKLFFKFIILNKIRTPSK